MRVLTTFYSWCGVHILFGLGVSLFGRLVSWCLSTLGWLGLSGCSHLDWFWYLLLVLSSCGRMFVPRVVRSIWFVSGWWYSDIHFLLVVLCFWCHNNVPWYFGRWCQSPWLYDILCHPSRPKRWRMILSLFLGPVRSGYPRVLFVQARYICWCVWRYADSVVLGIEF